jgi:hypothetical protein
MTASHLENLSFFVVFPAERGDDWAVPPPCLVASFCLHLLALLAMCLAAVMVGVVTRRCVGVARSCMQALHFGSRAWANAFTFATVRDPFALLVSTYFYAATYRCAKGDAMSPVDEQFACGTSEHGACAPWFLQQPPTATSTILGGRCPRPAAPDLTRVRRLCCMVVSRRLQRVAFGPAAPHRDRLLRRIILIINIIIIIIISSSSNRRCRRHRDGDAGRDQARVLH